VESDLAITRNQNQDLKISAARAPLSKPTMAKFFVCFSFHYSLLC